MARVRTATERVFALGRSQVESALEASGSAASQDSFYREVQMRNPSRSYFVEYDGRSHSLKAVVAYALQRQNSDTLALDFHANDAAAHVRKLGFKVIHVTAAKRR